MDAVELEWRYCVICWHTWQIRQDVAPTPWGKHEWHLQKCPSCGFEATAHLEPERVAACRVEEAATH